MKNLMLIVVCLISFNYIYSQESKDEIITKYITGKWEHVKSVYPNDSIALYDRTFMFYSDSTVVTISDSTTYGKGKWYVKDTCIFIYNVVTEENILILIDMSFIEHIDSDNLFVRRLWGFEEFRKTSFYKKVD